MTLWGTLVLDLDRGWVEVYKDDAGEWRWTLKSANGATVADSAEGYTERNDAKEAFEENVLGLAKVGESERPADKNDENEGRDDS